MKLRGYQEAAVDAVYDHLRTRDDNPVGVMPTGAGKSLVLAKIASDATASQTPSQPNTQPARHTASQTHSQPNTQPAKHTATCIFYFFYFHDFLQV